MPNNQQLVEIASTISTAAEKLNDFYVEEALELRFLEASQRMDKVKE